MPSMIVKKVIPAIKKVMFTAAAVAVLMQCSEEETIAPAVTNDTVIEAASSNATSVGSLTVTGSNTAFATVKDCKTCTYIVDESEQVIDGNVLGFKAGNIICLNKGVKYGNLEFVNIDGTVENPVIIATVGEEISSATAEVDASNPY
jgi:hypothetical protein